MKLDDVFDVNLFVEMQREKMVNVRPHDDKPLFIANYSDLAQFANRWNDVTLSCRGLIYDEDLNVIARPWKKFFNLGDAKSPDIDFSDLAEVTDKMDGSLGILYTYEDKPHMATRGSFHSEQAKWATKKIKYIYRHEGFDLSVTKDFTFLFEIIYPTNRIVVDYGSFEGLVLLGAVEIVTGHAMGPNEAAALLGWQGMVTEVMPYKSINDVLAADDRENTEGYVIRAGNRMVKWKRPDYVELHRLISNLSEKSVWSGLAGGKTVEELIDGLPDEFHGFVRETSEKLLAQFSKRRQEIRAKYVGKKLLAGAVLATDASESEKRKGFADLVRADQDKKYMFALLDNKPIDDLVWSELKPTGKEVP